MLNLYCCGHVVQQIQNKSNRLNLSSSTAPVKTLSGFYMK